MQMFRFLDEKTPGFWDSRIQKDEVLNPRNPEIQVSFCPRNPKNP